MTVSDLISRQAAIDSLTEIIINLKNVYGDMGSAVNGARECIKSLPSAEQERTLKDYMGEPDQETKKIIKSVKKVIREIRKENEDAEYKRCNL